MLNPMLDEEFLLKLDNHRHKEKFVKMVFLSFEEYPIAEVQGRITGGSVNVDGTSAVRRTCNFTMVAQDVNIDEYYWALNTKFKLYVGLRNDIDDRYDDIIWFNQGLFIMTSFSSSLNTNSYTISIGGKDKMCMLNGEIGGVVESVSANFGQRDILDEENNRTTEDVLIKDIILEAVHHYGKEPYHNIVVEDVDDEGLELLEYRGDANLYFLINALNSDVEQMSFEDQASQLKFYEYNIKTGECGTTPINITSGINYDKRISTLDASAIDPSTFTYVKVSADDKNYYSVAKIEYGETCGYRLTPLIYAGELILSTGDAITSMLDKLVDMLGEYEYYYDVNGVFHFRRKRTWVQQSWNTIRSGDYVENKNYNSPYSYRFNNSNLITTYQNQPNIANLRNDFSIWGTKPNDTTKFHLRYAIDKKPEKYVSYKGNVYISQDSAEEGETAYDWRELIYQMALDYYKYGHNDDFLATIGANNRTVYPAGYTGYEQYYADMEGFWRELYDPTIQAMNITENTIPDETVLTYYTWDDKTETFSSYSFSQMTSVKDVPDEPKFYWLYNTISEEDFNNLYNSPEIDNEDKNLYYLDDITIAERRVNHNGETQYWIFKQYYTYNLNAEYYKYGMLTDLTGLSREKQYYYIDDDGEYREAPREEAEDQFSYVGLITEEEYSSGKYYILAGKDNNNPLYQDATFYKAVQDYYVKAKPCIFNIFKDGYGVKYYENAENSVFSTIVPGHTYSLWDDEGNNVGSLTLPAGVDYYLVNGDVITNQVVKNFYRGNSYGYKSENGDLVFAFMYHPNITYKIAEPYYIQVADCEKVKENLNAVEQPSGRSLNNNTYYPTFYYNGYMSEKTEEVDNGDYYIVDNEYSTPTLRRVLRHFDPANTYYYIETDDKKYRPAKEKDLSLNNFENFYYKDGDKFINSWETIQQIVKDYPSDFVERIAETTGLSYVLVGNNWEVDGFADISKVYMIQKLQIYDILQYALYKVVEENDEYDPNETYYIKVRNRIYEKAVPQPTSQNDFKEKQYYRLLKTDEVKVYTTNKYFPPENEAKKHRWYWTLDINIPENLVFWFDFLDSQGGSELAVYGADSVGNRAKAVNDDNIKAIYYRDTPTVIFTQAGDTTADKSRSGYVYLNLTTNIDNLFVMSATRKTAFEQLDSFLMEHSHCAQSITVNAIPIYYLEPNTKIYVFDQETGINGDYQLTKMTIPLAYNGTMSISASRMVERIY